MSELKLTTKLRKQICIHPNCYWVAISERNGKNRPAEINIVQSVNWDWHKSKHPPIDLVIKSLLFTAYKKGKEDARSEIVVDFRTIAALIKEAQP